MLRIGLVGCVKHKRAVTVQAKFLYTSDLFVKAREYSEMHYKRWFVLSAKCHLVEPETCLEPYDETLNDKTAAERREWSATVFSQIAQRFPDPRVVELYFHAGARYREFLIPMLTYAGYSCKVPLEGLRIGEQMAWYKEHTGHG